MSVWVFTIRLAVSSCRMFYIDFNYTGITLIKALYHSPYKVSPHLHYFVPLAAKKSLHVTGSRQWRQCLLYIYSMSDTPSLTSKSSLNYHFGGRWSGDNYLTRKPSPVGLLGLTSFTNECLPTFIIYKWNSLGAAKVRLKMNAYAMLK